MTLPVVFHELAEDELNEAAAYYARTSIRLGEAFVAEVQHAVDLLAALPEAIHDLCEVFAIDLSAERKAAIHAMGSTELTVLRERLKRERRWP